MALMEKKRYGGRRTRMEKKRYGGRRTRKRTFRRRRTGLWVFVVLVILTIGATILYGTGFLTSETGEIVGQVEDEASEIVGEEESSTSGDDEDEATEEDEDEATPATPDDPTMFLSVPRLDIVDALVLGGEAGLELGVQHLEGAGYPWLPGSNTYMSGHRVGFPGTGSDHIFYNLPAMSEGDEIILRDTLDQEHKYEVTEIFAVTPFDVWVADPVAGKDMVSLQVCTETPDDWWTIGPRLMSSGPESGRLIVRAEKV
jgi:sortase A